MTPPARWYCCGVSHSYREQRCSECANPRRRKMSKRRSRENFDMQAPNPNNFAHPADYTRAAQPWWTDKD